MNRLALLRNWLKKIKDYPKYKVIYDEIFNFLFLILVLVLFIWIGKSDEFLEAESPTAFEQHKESVRSLEDELLANPRDSDIILKYSIALQNSGSSEKAIEVLKSGLSDIQTFNATKQNSSLTQVFYAEVPLYIKLGELYLEFDDLDGALAILEEGVTRNSGSGELLDQYLNLLHSIGEGKRAMDILKQQCSKYFVSDGVCNKSG